MKNVNEKKIEDLLLKAGLITFEKLKKLKDRESKTGEKIEKILIEESSVNYKEVLKLIADRMGLEFIDLENLNVNKNAIGYITPEIARRYSIFPFDIKNNLLFLAMYNPDEVFLIDEIKIYSQMEIKPFLADRKMINNAISYFYSEKTAKEELKCDIETSKEFCKEMFEDDIKEDEAVMGENVVDLAIRTIISRAYKNNASDIHLDKLNNGLRVRYRIDGALIEEKEKFTVSPEEISVSFKVMGGLLSSDRSIPLKGRVSYNLSKKERIYIDVLILPTVCGDKVLLKLESKKSTFTLEEVGLSDLEKDIVEIMINKKNGILIVTGTNHSGRTSTVFALLKKLLDKKINIITLEKRITEKLHGVSQFQIPNKMEEGVVDLLKSISDYDADVLMIDTPFSPELFKYSTKLALEGKLIIITASFVNTFETLSSLINGGIEPYTITASLEGVISQLLIRKLCIKCKGERLSENQLHVESSKATCNECDGSGYKGKIGIFEVFNMNREYRKVILGKDSIIELEKKLENEKSTIKINARSAVNAEKTSIGEIIRLGIGEELFKN